MNKSLTLIVVAISLATVVSGFTQMVAPAFVLRFVGADITPASAHFFAIVGMFMVLFGGLMLHAVYSVETSRVAILWAALQKLGASIAVGIGIVHGIFAFVAGAVAGFDLLSGILFLMYWQAVKNNKTA
jgi:uncharacterized protein YjeT (DUF2065 family)